MPERIEVEQARDRDAGLHHRARQTVLPPVVHEVGHGPLDVVLGVDPGARLEVPVELRHVAGAHAAAGEAPGYQEAARGTNATVGTAASRR